MSSTPETRPSLLIRVRDPGDQAAWLEFVELYRPIILRLARQKGMQEADAEDVAQEVLAAVAKAVEQREHDPKRAKISDMAQSRSEQRDSQCPDSRKTGSRLGRFGNAGCAQSARVAHWARFGPVAVGVPAGGVSHGRAARSQGVPRGHVGRILADRHRRASVEVAAEELGKKPGAIYAARSRVIRRIQEKVTEHEQET